MCFEEVLICICEGQVDFNIFQFFYVIYKCDFGVVLIDYVIQVCLKKDGNVSKLLLRLIQNYCCLYIYIR